MHKKNCKCANLRIKQKGITFDHDFCYSFSFFSSLFFSGGMRKEEKNNQSRGQNACLSARSKLIHDLI